MFSVGLTGNAAAGKSTVAELFARWGAVVIDADRLVRDVQAPGSDVLRAIVERFGPEVLNPDGSLDRDRLRRRVLRHPDELADLNAIVHPAVRRRRDTLVQEARAAGVAILVEEIPLLFEALDPAAFDFIVLVDAPADVRKERLLVTRGLSTEEADRLIAAQLPADIKRERSDYVIENRGDLRALERAAREAWRIIQLRSSAPDSGSGGTSDATAR